MLSISNFKHQISRLIILIALMASTNLFAESINLLTKMRAVPLNAHSTSIDGNTVLLMLDRDEFSIYKVDSKKIISKKFEDQLSPMRNGLPPPSYLTPDGRYAIFIGQEKIAIYRCDDGERVWIGQSEQYKFYNVTVLGANYLPEIKEFQLVTISQIVRFSVEKDDVARFISSESIKFSESARSKANDYVLSAAFEKEGAILYVGNKDADVVKIDISNPSDPKMISRQNAFNPKVSDEHRASDQDIATLKCAENCGYLIARSSNYHWVSVINTKTMQVVAVRHDENDKLTLLPLGYESLIFQRSDKWGQKTATITDLKFEPLIDINHLGLQYLPASFSQGVVDINFNQAPMKTRIFSLDEFLTTRRQAKSLDSKKNEITKGIDINNFRSSLKIGTETQCGPVVELRNPMVKVARLIKNIGSEHWMKIANVLPPGGVCHLDSMPFSGKTAPSKN